MKCPLSLLAAIVLAGCGAGESAHTHAPEEIERLQASESVAEEVDQFERLSRLHILLLQKSQALLDSIVDEATADKAAASWYDLFPIQVEVEYLGGWLLDFTELNDQRSEARKKYGSQIEKSRQQLLDRQRRG